MKLRWRAPISTAIAMAVGLIVLAGFFWPSGPLLPLREVFLRWAMILGAVALVVGILNLSRVHLRKLTKGEPGAAYSGVLLITLAATAGVALWRGPTDWATLWIFQYIQVPVETSLMALLAVVLAVAAARLLERRLNLFSVVLLVTALLTLLGTITLPGMTVPGLSELRAWIAQVPAAGGARGILLGVALGVVATALRVLIGADRPYGGG
jgi:hypothetical protein